MKTMALAALATVLFPTFVHDTSLRFSNSIFSVIAFAGILALFTCAKTCASGRRKTVYTHILGSLFSVMTAFGARLEGLDGIPYGSLLFWLAIAVYAHVFAQGISVLWSLLERKEAGFRRPEQLPVDGRMSSRLCRAAEALMKRPVLLWAALLVCWAPCYISTFPGNLVYDASYEYYQLQTGFTKSFPLLHSAIITRLFSLSEALTGSVNAGVALYVITQMMLAAALFATILRRFFLDGLHPLLTLGLAAYYALCPVVHLLVTCTTRDVLFIALLTCTVYQFYLLARDPHDYMSKTRHMITLSAVLVLTLLARNNNSGPLAIMLLLGVCVLICLIFGRRFIRNSLLFTASALGMFYAVTAVLTALCQPLYEAPPSSAMSILAQPIVRTHALHADEWTPEERTEFESYFNMETLEYVPQNADPAKGNLTVRYRNMREFLAFWIKMGLRYPGCYLDAVLVNTRQMWYPGVVIDGYTVRGMFPAYEKNYFYFGKYIEEIGSRLNLLPGVFAFYEDIGLNVSFERIPLVSMIFSIGFQVWLLLHCLFYAAYRKCYHLFWLLGIVLIYTICCACVPLVLLRYFGALFLVMPMIAAFTFCPDLVCRKN